MWRHVATCGTGGPFSWRSTILRILYFFCGNGQFCSFINFVPLLGTRRSLLLVWHWASDRLFIFLYSFFITFIFYFYFSVNSCCSFHSFCGAYGIPLVCTPGTSLSLTIALLCYCALNALDPLSGNRHLSSCSLPFSLSAHPGVGRPPFTSGRDVCKLEFTIGMSARHCTSSHLVPAVPMAPP